MSSTSSPTLIPDISARRSEPVVAMLAIAAGCGAPSMIDALPIGVAALAGLSTAALLTLGFVRAGWLGAVHRIQRAVWSAGGAWVLIDARGRRMQAVLDDASRVWPHILWLRWRAQDGDFRPRSMLLTRLDLPASDLRRLVARLRLDRFRSAPAPEVAAV